MTRVTRLNWRTVAAALPAVALIGSGMALVTVDGHPSTDAVADSRPVVTVPQDAVQRPEAPTLPALPALPAPAEATATQVASAAGLQLSGAANGIPAAALAAYRRGAALVDAADAECNIDWALLAAIGKVESNHGRYGGNGVDTTGTVRPGIYGIPLDGTNGTAVIRDTDGGAFDRDASYDRAVGPMQFIPGTWRSVGVDANGDGRKDPQNLMDAVTGAAVYLCSGPGDLGNESGARTAVLRYNQSDAYADQVLAIARAYRGGYAVVPDGTLSEAQRTGQPFLPTGTEAVRPGAAAGVAGAGGGRPSASSGPGTNGSTPSASGTSGAEAGSGGSGAGGSGSPSSGSTPAPSTTAGGGGLVGTVGGIVGGVTGQTPSPTSSSATSSTPRTTPTPRSTSTPPKPPVTVPPVNGRCPTGYDPTVNALGIVTLCTLH